MMYHTHACNGYVGTLSLDISDIRYGSGKTRIRPVTHGFLYYYPLVTFGCTEVNPNRAKSGRFRSGFPVLVINLRPRGYGNY